MSRIGDWLACLLFAVAGVKDASGASEPVPPSAPFLLAQPLGQGITRVYFEPSDSDAWNRDIQALVSPKRDWVAIQGGVGFVVLPAAGLPAGAAEVSRRRGWAGEVVGFLSGGRLLFVRNGDAFALDPKSEEITPVLEGCSVPSPDDGVLVIGSDRLLISGTGNAWDGTPGTILRYELDKRRVTKGPEIPAFWLASLSPSRRYLGWQYGDESSNETMVYDIPKGRVYSVAPWIPKGFGGGQAPLCWVGPDLLLVSVWRDQVGAAEVSVLGYRIVLLDVKAGRAVWSVRPPFPLLPNQVVAAGRDRVLLNDQESGAVVSLALKTGRITPMKGVRGYPIAVSLDGSSLAMVEITGEPLNARGAVKIRIRSLKGGQEREVLVLPAWTFQRAHKGMGARPPSLDVPGALLLFGEKELLVVGVVPAS